MGNRHGLTKVTYWTFQDIQEDVVRMVWNCSVSKAYKEEVPYFVALDFAVPVDTAIMRTMPLRLLTSWLIQANDRSFVESISDADEVAACKDPP